jgi:hypothetical protein
MLREVQLIRGAGAGAPLPSQVRPFPRRCVPSLAGASLPSQARPFRRRWGKERTLEAEQTQLRWPPLSLGGRGRVQCRASPTHVEE